MSDISRILSAMEMGDPRAAEDLLPLVYDELRRLAASWMAQERPGHTLQATALVHEAYIRLVEGESLPDWESRGHFFAAAATAMRRILVDGARRKNSAKRGAGWQRQELIESELVVDSTGDDLFAVDEALSRLADQMPELAKFVELRFFAGMTVEEAARCLGVSERTAYRNWTYARAWLRRELDRSAPD